MVNKSKKNYDPELNSRELKAKLALLGMTQSDLAKKLKVKKSAITMAVKKGYKNGVVANWIRKNLRIDLSNRLEKEDSYPEIHLKEIILKCDNSPFPVIKYKNSEDKKWQILAIFENDFERDFQFQKIMKENI